MSKTGLARDDPQFGVIRPIALVMHVKVLADGESFRVGSTMITAHLTPGHTPGGTSWTWKSCEGSKCLGLVYADSLTPVSAEGFKFTRHANAAQDFRKSFAFLRSTPCDILLTTHPDVSSFWDRLDARQKVRIPDPMIDATACRNLADSAEEALKKRITSEASD
jgi:metallo-beta-lactamase class B